MFCYHQMINEQRNIIFVICREETNENESEDDRIKVDMVMAMKVKNTDKDEKTVDVAIQHNTEKQHAAARSCHVCNFSFLILLVSKY